MGSVFFPEEDVKLIQSGQTCFSGALLIADISGFTAITETLSLGGNEGVEELTSLLNRCFNKMLKVIHRKNGSVITFSGDSILARFTDPERASLCAEELLNEMREFRRVVILGELFSIRVKILVGTGRWNQYIAGNRKRAHLLIAGNLVRELAQREQNAQPDEIIVFENLSEPSGEPCKPPETLPESFLTPGSMRLHGEYRPVTPVFFTVTPGKDSTDAFSCFQQLYLNIRQTVSNYGGHIYHIDNLASEGTRIMALFGIPVSSGKDTLNGVLSALELVCAQNTSPFVLSAGIDTGYVFSGIIGNDTRKQHTVIGDPVNTAARLAEIAAPGTVTVSPAVKSATSGTIQYCEPVRVSLKGKKIILEAFQASGRCRDKLFSPFVGRHREISELREKVLSGNRPLLLSGTAGIGKSMLLDALSEELVQLGLIPVKGAAGMRGTGTDILSSILESICGGGEESDLDSFIDSIGNPQLTARKMFLANMLLRLDIRDLNFERLPPKLRSENLLDALIILLSSLKKRTCVFIEDIQQTGEEELDFLFKAIHGVMERSDTAFILSTRPEGEKKIPEESGVEKYQLKGLNSSESRRLLFEYAEQIPISDETSRLLTDRARGNPFFLVQFLLYMKERNAISVKQQQDRTREEILSELPESVFSMVMARIDTMSEKTRDSLKVASVAGMRFSEKVIGSVMKRDVQQEMDEALRSGLILAVSHKKSEYVFSHMLIRDVAYDSILSGRRKQLHRKTGYALETEAAGDNTMSASLANHFQRGEVWDKAAECFISAGALASDDFRNGEALSFFQTAADILEKHLPPEKNTLAGCFNRCGDIQDRTGNFDSANEYYRKAVAYSEDTRLTQRSLISIADILFNQGNIDDSLELIEEVEKIVRQSSDDHSDTLTQVAAFKAWSYCVQGQIEMAEEEALKAVTLGESLTGYKGYEKARKLGHALNTLATVHWARSDYASARNLYERAVEIALANGLKREAAVTWGNIGLTLEKQGLYEEAVINMRKQLDVSTEIGEKLLILSAHGDLGMTFAAMGDFDQALKHTSMQLELAEQMKVAHDQVLALNCLANMEITRGNLKIAETLVEKAARILDEKPLERELVQAFMIRGRLAALHNAPDRAKEMYGKALELAEKVQGFSLQHQILIDSAELSIARGKMKEAEEAVEISIEIAKKKGMGFAVASSRLVGGMIQEKLGNLLPAENAYRECIGIFENLGTKYQLARALHSLGTLMKGKPEAAELLGRSEKLFEQMKVPLPF